MLASLRRLIERKRDLQPIDRLVLEKVRAELDESLRARWDMQVSAITFVQRMPDGCEIEFCQLDVGNTAKRFTDVNGELLLAEVNFMMDKRKLDADVWCVDGELFSIEYSHCGLMRALNRRLSRNPAAGSATCRLRANLARGETAPLTGEVNASV